MPVEMSPRYAALDVSVHEGQAAGSEPPSGPTLAAADMETQKRRLTYLVLGGPASTYTLTHIYIQTRLHTYTHVRTHVHTHTRVQSLTPTRHRHHHLTITVTLALTLTLTLTLILTLTLTLTLVLAMMACLIFGVAGVTGGSEDAASTATSAQDKDSSSGSTIDTASLTQLWHPSYAQVPPSDSDLLLYSTPATATTSISSSSSSGSGARHVMRVPMAVIEGQESLLLGT